MNAVKSTCQAEYSSSKLLPGWNRFRCIWLVSCVECGGKRLSSMNHNSAVVCSWQNVSSRNGDVIDAIRRVRFEITLNNVALNNRHLLGGINKSTDEFFWVKTEFPWLDPYQRNEVITVMLTGWEKHSITGKQEAVAASMVMLRCLRQSLRTV